MATMEDVARLALALPEAIEGMRHGNRTWFVAGKGFAWERPFSKADLRRFGADTPPDGPIAAVKVADLHDKEASLAEHPASFFTIAHFDGYAAVLIQLNKAKVAEVREAVEEAWLACAPRKLADAYLARSSPARRHTRS
jgi:hypothetical protein